MNRLRILIALIVLMIAVDGIGYCVPNSFLITDVSTYTVAGANGAHISTTTFSATGGINSPVDATIGITRLILSNGTTAAWTIHIYEYGTLNSTNTIVNKISVNLSPMTTTGSTQVISWDTNYEPIIKHILIRKANALYNANESAQNGYVTAYVQYYRR